MFTRYLYFMEAHSAMKFISDALSGCYPTRCEGLRPSCAGFTTKSVLRTAYILDVQWLRWFWRTINKNEFVIFYFECHLQKCNFSVQNNSINKKT
jgi:hypothetical protein